MGLANLGCSKSISAREGKGRSACRASSRRDPAKTLSTLPFQNRYSHHEWKLSPAHLPFAANVTARPVSGSLTPPAPYPRPRCASSGKGHSHAATPELTFSRQPARADPEKPVSEGPTGHRSRGTPRQNERRVRPQGRRRFFFNLQHPRAKTRGPHAEQILGARPRRASTCAGLQPGVTRNPPNALTHCTFP